MDVEDKWENVRNPQSTVSRIYYPQVSRVFIVVTPTRRIAADFRPFSLTTRNHPAKTEAVFFLQQHKQLRFPALDYL